MVKGELLRRVMLIVRCIFFTILFLLALFLEVFAENGEEAEIENKHTIDEASHRRLENADEESRRILEARRRIREAKRKNDDLNEKDKDFYRDACGLSGRRFSRVKCQQLERELNTKRAERRRAIELMRKNLRSSR
jgi:Skp family chaperone for outer membrane proteins